MQLRSKITVARNIRIHHHSLLNAKHKGVADGMVKTTLKQLGKRFNSSYMASDFYMNIWIFWNTGLQRVQVNQRQFECYSRKNFALPTFLVVCLTTM